MTRTDIHRVSQIKPEEYVIVFSYALASTSDGWPVPSFRINCALDKRHEVDGQIVNGTHHKNGNCCVIGLRQSGKKLAEHGAPGTCTICGTWHIYGDVWRHESTGEHIFVGHQCADKYNLIADRRAFEKALKGVRVRSVREHEKAIRHEERQNFIDAHDGLRDALETDHRIVRDIKDRFLNGRYTTLTEGQLNLVMKLYRESLRPQVVEHHVPAPIEAGRQVVEGTVVSVKCYDGNYGLTFKITVKVHTDEGTWLAWGTCPTSLLDAEGNVGGKKLRGAKVRFAAKLKKGRDDHFALFSRPTQAEVVEWAKNDAAEAA
jgi:hypothetical protein